MIVHLLGYEPPSRNDGNPWTQAVIERGPTSSGPWTQIAQLALSPLDADPVNPQVRNFSFEDVDGTVQSWYRIYFVDAAARESLPSTPITGAYRVQYLPALHEVGSLARTRTKTDAGELGTFTSATRPQSSAVRDLIRQAGNDVAAEIGYEVPFNVIGAARNLVIYRTAMLIELSYFAETVSTPRSPYQQYKELYDGQLPIVEKAVAESEEDDEVEAGGDGMPSWGGMDACNSTSMTEPW